jgi:hypothetical protein
MGERGYSTQIRHNTASPGHRNDYSMDNHSSKQRQFEKNYRGFSLME